MTEQILMLIIIHLPKKIQRFERRRHCIEPWMNRELLSSVNKKNDKYRNWKSTNNDFEYELKKIKFKTLERIVKENICKTGILFQNVHSTKK